MSSPVQQGKPCEHNSQLLVNFNWSLVAVGCFLLTVELNVFIISIINANPLFEQCQGRRGFPVLRSHNQSFSKAELSKVTHVGKLYKTNNLWLVLFVFRTTVLIIQNLCERHRWDFAGLSNSGRSAHCSG